MPIVDLLVIGGGIHGACVARDAALRGLSVTLVEKDDLASGTSSRSSKLIHGGLRYLETGQIGLVREALREREILMRIAPELVRHLPFLLPFYEGDARPPWMLRAGLTLYDLLARTGRSHAVLRRDDMLSLVPRLSPEGLKGGALYEDAQMDDALLVIANAYDAAESGATIRTRTEVASLERTSTGWLARLPWGETLEARAVVNAAGPWADIVRARARKAPAPALRLTRGTHIVLPALTEEMALLLFARRDGRVFFVLPWDDYSLVGTTDTDDDSGPDRVAPTAEDVRYLWEEIDRRWPDARASRSTVRVFAGVRPLARSGSHRPWDNSREARLLVEEGMISLVGGKYTTARLLAERAVDLVVRELGRPTNPCTTAVSPLPTLAPGTGVARSQVEFAVDDLFARSVSDVVFRRSSLWLHATRAGMVASDIADWMAPKLGWTAETRSAEVKAVYAQVDAEERILEKARKEYP